MEPSNNKLVYQSKNLTLSTPNSEQGADGLLVEILGNLSVQGDVLVQGEVIQVDDIVSFAVADTFIVLNFGETGPGVVDADASDKSGILVDRGMYSLVESPTVPGLYVVERVGDEPDGAPVYRDDPLAQGIIDENGNVAPPGSYPATSPSTIIWQEEQKGWNFQTSLTDRKDQSGNALPELQLPNPPRLLNIASPADDNDRNTAAPSGWVLDKDAIIQNDLDELKNDYLNITQLPKNLNSIMYWDNTTGGLYNGSWKIDTLNITYDTSPTLGGDLNLNNFIIKSNNNIVLETDIISGNIIQLRSNTTSVLDVMWNGSEMIYDTTVGGLNAIFRTNSSFTNFANGDLITKKYADDNYIADAPSNGKQYARQDTTWTEVAPDTVESVDGRIGVVTLDDLYIGDAPVNGIPYARQSTGWVETVVKDNITIDAGTY